MTRLKTTHTANNKQILVSTEYQEQLEIASEVLGMVAILRIVFVIVAWPSCLTRSSK